ncbi:DUF2189 domain-containing protein [Hyphococcus sp.]|uniref:DUF2189 domain-containing protein n=1 Tax=Hyphococcus sp. TaxID=2038636 RepID=UPI0035C6E2B3
MTNIDGRQPLNPVSVNDLVDIIAAGARDFFNAPLYGLVFGALFAAAGWVLIALLLVLGLPYLAYPLAMGFALVAPFAAAGFYAVSDHLEQGKPLSWGGVLGGVKNAIGRDLRWMALVTGFALVIWMDIAAFLFFAFTGFHGVGPDFLDRLLSTPSGVLFLVLGNLSGAIIALSIFSISAISFPMLYDRDVDFVTAMVASVRLVMANPVAMCAWCALIGVAMGLSVLSGFVGFLVVLPVIGHATWRLYRHAVPVGAPHDEANFTHMKVV